MICSTRSRRAGRSCHAPLSDSARASSAAAAAWQAAVSCPWRASRSRTTRITSRCAVTVPPSTLKVSSEDPASRPSASSTTSGGTPPGCSGPASAPACPAACSSARGTPAADSTDTRSITALHTPVPSPARTASSDSSTAAASPCGYWPALDPQQQLVHRLVPQPLQVGRIVQVLGGDHRGGLRQRQRQPAQLGRQQPGARGVGGAGPVGQERQRLLLGEHVHRHARAQVRHRLLVAGDQHPGRPRPPGGTGADPPGRRRYRRPAGSGPRRPPAGAAPPGPPPPRPRSRHPARAPPRPPPARPAPQRCPRR